LWPATQAHADALALGINVVAFDGDLARDAGALRPLTRAARLSLGDRCCLALGRLKRAAVLTTEARWGSVAKAVEVKIQNIRPQTSRRGGGG
jgi:PIN domain nuclease of toxin-antitoxin system